jgi:hypothetical protein
VIGHHKKQTFKRERKKERKGKGRKIILGKKDKERD